MEDKHLLAPTDEREGRFLLNEILMVGNSGQYDEHLQQKLQSSVLSFIADCLYTYASQRGK